jgi:hypothetical protein
MERRLEKRLSLVYSKIKKEKETNSVSQDIKNMLDEFRKASKEDSASRQQAANENEKHKVIISAYYHLGVFEI